jgi:hypothetical protein
VVVCEDLTSNDTKDPTDLGMSDGQYLNNFRLTRMKHRTPGEEVQNPEFQENFISLNNKSSP